MLPTPSRPETANAEPLIPLPRLASFIRQLSHDIRNGLNAIDLEASLIAEITTEPEIAAEAKKLRGMVSNVTRSLQTLSGRFAEIKLSNAILCPVSDFLEVLRERVEQEFSDRASDIKWRIETEKGAIEIDFELVIAALSEILRNAFQFRTADAPIEFHVREEDALIVFEVRTQSSPGATQPETWGLEPLVSTRRSGYGLGLFYARRIIQTHGGTLNPVLENGSVVTRVRLPLNTAPPDAG